MQSPEIHIKGSAAIGNAVLFSSIDITVQSGVWTCLLGPSGVGKSSILRLIAGLDYGIDFQGTLKASHSLKNQVSLMAQDSLLLPWATVRQNVALGNSLRGDKIDHDKITALIDDVGLSKHGHKYPAELSGGQRQRAALARTMNEKKPVILLDEPFSALDAKTRLEMQELAAEKLGSKTVFLVTHDPSEAARLCRKIYLLSSYGCECVPAQDPPFPKHYADPKVLALQSVLLEKIRGT